MVETEEVNHEFQTISIRQAVDRIYRHDYVLPAIQRELVWDPDQITHFFDSLMQGYPIGSLLFWKVRKEALPGYRFYEFVRVYHEKESPHCSPLGDPPHGDVTVVLDGQQRLTALNIGLNGSHAEKEKGKRRDDLAAYPEKHLYLDITANPLEMEDGEAYDFRFLSEKQVQAAKGPHWFRVSEIGGFGGSSQVFRYVQKAKLAEHPTAFDALSRLHDVVKDKEGIAFYEEDTADFDKALNVFIRLNSGGTQLSNSDMLFSIATAGWKKLDARKEINELVEKLNGTRSEFSFSKDFVLKAGLMLTDASVEFKAVNLRSKNAVKLEKHWPEIANALRLAVELVEGFGFSGQTLSAHNAVLPIAYSLYQRHLDSKYVTNAEFDGDRRDVRRWLVRSLLKAGVWGSSVDTLLTSIQTALRDHGSERFPVKEIEAAMRSRGKSLRFDEEELEDLVDVSYKDRKKRTFALLSLLFPHLDLQNKFHIDHIFPRSCFHKKRLDRLGLLAEDQEEWREQADRLANLQLLDGTQNMEKGALLPHEWLKETFPQDEARAAFIDRHRLGELPETLEGFPAFYEARREALLGRLRKLLEVTPAASSAA